MGQIKENVYITPHVQEEDWIGFIVRVHQENISLDSTSPTQDTRGYFFGLLDAALAQTSFDTYINNNFCSAFKTWYSNRSTSSQEHIKDAFAALQVD